ncbi:MAG: fatty acid desaturase [Armatimonadetes bacterium]|nr:fatty acid desaturase [Armatimonadota bacterium]
MATILTPPETPEKAIPNYRQQIRRELPDHVFRPDHQNLLWFAVHAAIIGGSWYVLRNHFSFWVAPFLSIAIGHSFGCMGFIGHDIAHGGTFKSMRMRDILAGIAFSPFWISPLLWRKWHNGEHHGHTQVDGEDPDALFTMEHYKNNPVLRFLYRLSPVLRNIIIFGSFSFRMTQQNLRMLVLYLFKRPTKPREKVQMVLELVLQASAWIGVSWYLGSQVLIWGYLLPLLVANALVISYIATNHFLNPLADESDVLGSSLTVTLPPALRWLDPWHQYFGAHVAHHLFPQVSARNTRYIEDKAKELFPDRYHSMPLTTALVLLWKTPWIYETHTTFIDPQADQRIGTLGHGLEEEFGLKPKDNPHLR